MQIDREFKSIDYALRLGDFGREFELEQRNAVTLLELQEHMLRFRPNILHFSGHGSDQGRLIFENQNGGGDEAPSLAIASLFEILNSNRTPIDPTNILRCIVLSACYSLEQAEAISRYVDCVVGVSRAIKDESAIVFSTSFYRGLSYGMSAQAAFDLGRNQLQLSENVDEKIVKLVHRENIDPNRIDFINANRSNTSVSDKQSEIGMSSGNLRISDIRMAYEGEGSWSCTLDIRAQNDGDSTILINSLDLVVLDVGIVYTLGFKEYSHKYDLDISNLMKKGQVANLTLAQEIRPREIDRFAVVLTARELGTGVFARWKLQPRLNYNYGSVSGNPLTITLPHPIRFFHEDGTPADDWEAPEEIYGKFER
ncbi:MAG: CHAT domain-containing protein [Nitrososphaera sp.]